MDVKLIVIEGLHRGKAIPIPGDRFVIGRDSRCNLRPRSEMVDERHCALVRRGDQVVVVDLGSRIGTLVNDRCLRRDEEMRLSDGDRLQVGRLSFLVRIEDAATTDRAAELGWMDPAATVDTRGREGPNGSAPDAGGDPHSWDWTLSGSGVAASPEAPARFAYQEFDEPRGAACIGLGPDSFDSDEHIQALRRSLLEWTSDPFGGRMVLDLGGSAPLPAAACALLRALSDRCELAGGELRLCGVAHEVRELLKTLRLDQRIPVHEDRDQALTAPW